MAEKRYYYFPVFFDDEAITVAKWLRDNPPCTPSFDTHAECMQWFKDKGYGDRKYIK